MIEGHNTASTYVKILEEHMVPMLHHMIDEMDDPVFMHDNSRVHTAKLTTAWRENNTIPMTSHPPYSPDINAIEQVQSSSFYFKLISNQLLTRYRSS